VRIGVALSFTRKADDALTLIREHPADVLLVDLVSSNAEGLKLLRQLRDKPPMKFMIVTALTDANKTVEKLRAFELGATNCLSKPFEPAVFRAQLLAEMRTKQRHDELTGVIMNWRRRAATPSHPRAPSPIFSRP